MSWLGNSANAWMVTTTFLVTVILGMFFGYLKGWKKSLYFCLWNFLMLIIVVFMTPVLFSAAFSSADASTTSGVILSNVSPYILPMLMIPVLIFMDLLAFIPYYWIKKLDFMQDSLKEPKFNLGSLSSNMLGMGIGFISIIPMAALVTNVTTIATGHVAFTSFNDSLLTMSTFGQFEGIADEMTSIKSTVHILDEKGVANEKTSGKDGLFRLLTGNLAIDSENHVEAINSINENHSHYVNIFESSLANSLITDLPDFQTIFIEGGQEAWANFNTFELPDKLEPFKLTKAAENNLYHTIIVLAEFGDMNWNVNETTGRIEQVDSYIAKLQGK